MNWRDASKAQVKFVEEQTEAIEQIRIELGVVARRFEAMDGDPASLIASILISAKESIGRIESHYLDTVFMDNMDHFRGKLEQGNEP